MTEKQYKVGYFDDPNDVDSYVECDGEYLDASDVVRILNKLQEENEQLKGQNKHLSNIIKCLEKGSCRTIDSFLDSYCTDELLNEYGLNEDDLFYGDSE